MSANFIVEYAGAPVRFTDRQVELVPEKLATPFNNEAAAWHAAHEAKLPVNFVNVANTYLRDQKFSGGIQTAPTVSVAASGAGRNG